MVESSLQWRRLAEVGWGSFDEAGHRLGYSPSSAKQSVHSLIFGRNRAHPVSRVKLNDVRKIGVVYVVRLAALDDLTHTYPVFRPDDVALFKMFTHGFWSVGELAEEINVARQRAWAFVREGRIPYRHVFAIDHRQKILALAAQGVQEFLTEYRQDKNTYQAGVRRESARRLFAREQLAIRRWAADKGYDISAKGPIPKPVTERYAAEQKAVTQTGAQA